MKKVKSILFALALLVVGVTTEAQISAKKVTWVHAAKVHAILKVEADPKFVSHFSYEDLEFVASQGDKGISAILMANDLILDTFMQANAIAKEAMMGLGFKGKDHFKMSLILEKACQERIAELDSGAVEGNPPVPDMKPQSRVMGNPPVPDM